jgi:hypothetical protein
MADRTATLESTIDRLAKAKRVSTGRRAVAEREKLALEKYRS